MRSGGAEFCSIEVKEIEKGNRGIFATHDIMEGERVILIPKDQLIMEESVKNDPDFAQKFPKLMNSEVFSRYDLTVCYCFYLTNI